MIVGVIVGLRRRGKGTLGVRIDPDDSFFVDDLDHAVRCEVVKLALKNGVAGCVTDGFQAFFEQ